MAARAVTSGLSRRRSGIRTAAFAALATILVLALIESGLRLTHVGGKPIDMIYTDVWDVRYRLRPGALSPSPQKGERINSMGTRGPEFAEEKPSGVTRILCLGDSTTFGGGLSADQTYPAQLQSMLDVVSPGRYQVINGGIPGTNTYQHLLFYEGRARRWDPDVVVWRVAPNGRDNIHIYRLRSRWIGGRALITMRDALSRLRIYRLLRGLMLDERPTQQPEVAATDDAVFSQEYEEDLAHIAELAQRDGFTPIWLHVPVQQTVLEAQELLAGMPSGPGAAGALQDLAGDRETAEFTRRMGFAYVDVLPRFAAQAVGPDLFVDPGHPGPLGQRICAEEVMRKLQELGLVQ